MKLNLSKYHPTVSSIVSLLEKETISFETFEHEEVLTSEQAAKTRPGFTLSQGAKALILKSVYKDKTKPTEFIMFVLPGDKKLNSKQIKNQLSLREISFANPDEIVTLTNGIKIGGIPPFGNLFGLKVYVDTTLFLNQKIVFNAGDRRFSIAILASDYKRLVHPEIINLVDTI